MSVVRQAWKIGILTFFLSTTISALSRLWTHVFVFWLSIIPLLLVIGIGIVFDIIGTAAAAAEETPFHAMAADKVHGAKKAIWLVRKADRVANFCNDVIGDICGTVSGALTAALVIDVTSRYYHGSDTDLISIVSLGLVAALTVAGKALGKSEAIRRADRIIFRVGQALATAERILGRGHTKSKNAGRQSKKRTPSRKRGV